MSADKKAEREARQRLRSLRRARRYIAENQGKLARLLNAHARNCKADPDRALWNEA